MKYLYCGTAVIGLLSCKYSDIVVYKEVTVHVCGNYISDCWLSKGTRSELIRLENAMLSFTLLILITNANQAQDVMYLQQNMFNIDFNITQN